MKVAFASVLCSFILALFLFPSAAFAQQGRIPVPRQYGLGAPFQIADLPPGQLRSALESLPAAARSRAMERLHSFSFPHQDIDYLRADKDGGIFYADPVGADLETESAPLPGEAAPALTFDPGRAFLLHSLPGSPRKVLLNFEGGVVSGTAWNSNPLQALPYDTDGNPENFSDAERRVIADIWHRVAEDFAPFNIDVTTERPATFGPLVGHVMITKDIDAYGVSMPSKGAGGVAYVNVWGGSNYATSYSPAFVYFNNLGVTSAHNIAEAAAHEFGHNLGLSHDGTSTTAYYSGLGTGNVSWGPIMGVGYYAQVTQWSKGEYPDANNLQDDVAIIAAKLPFRADDQGNTPATAAMLAVDADGTVWSSNQENDPENFFPQNKGFVGTTADVDYFAFDHAGGAVSLTVTPAWNAFAASKRGANLDIAATLYDSLGMAIAVSEPPTDTEASILTILSAGRYYLAIAGVGNPVTPYSDYGSLGHYVINGSVAIAPLRADFTYTTSALQSAFTDMSTDSAGTITSWDWNFGDGGSSTAQHPAHSYAAGGSYTVTLTVADSEGLSAETSRMITVTQPNVPPDASFTYSATGAAVYFTDTSTDSDGTVASWSWNFGDGSTSTTRHPAHTYAAGGDYTVMLTVTDDRGATRSVQQVVVITGPPRAPSDLVASVVTSGTKAKTKTVTLNWRDNSSNETAFVVQRCTETGKGAVKTCTFADVARAAADVTTYKETLGSGTYRYRVRGSNAFGDSGYSNEVRK
jgi:PKD repeat protein